MVHELPDGNSFYAAASRALKAGGRMLLAEPRGHVSTEDFARTLEAAASAGLRGIDAPSIRGSRTALLEKPGRT